MKKPLVILSLLLLVGCGNIRYIETKEQTITHYVDSIAWHDSTIYHHIYHEHYKDYTGPKDTLNLETTYSRFKAWNDSTSNTLKGEAVNKEDSIPVKIKWKEKVIQKDSLIYVEKPVPVEVEKKIKYIPKFFWFAFGWFILSIIFIVLKIYLKFKGK